MDKEKKDKEYLKQEAAIGLNYGGELVAKWAKHYKIKWIVRGILIWMLGKWILFGWILKTITNCFGGY